MLSWHTVATGLDYPESLRWHDGALWLSDFYQHRVVKLGSAAAETLMEMPGQPSGLGWMPDRSLLVVEIHPRRVLGGEDQRLLYVGVADDHGPRSTPGGTGRILALPDEAPSEAAQRSSA